LNFQSWSIELKCFLLWLVKKLIKCINHVYHFSVGFTEPTSGTAEIEGFDIRYDMDRIYSLMGVCPQVKL
jgi:hypothetical protein